MQQIAANGPAGELSARHDTQYTHNTYILPIRQLEIETHNVLVNEKENVCTIQQHICNPQSTVHTWSEIKKHTMKKKGNNNGVYEQLVKS